MVIQELVFSETETLSHDIPVTRSRLLKQNVSLFAREPTHSRRHRAARCWQPAQQCPCKLFELKKYTR